ncbi:universal stress protein [Amycolatopsis tolypomycina]|uniref:Nucleotide-binding universal stress protein, UspA family n=1 Tax=Amycolatopsis tolypomycina TaxID=208445 RepID=A0A1H4U0Y6_9PSEU|nr:universal stress protein [Amycolatopsis tolypomycina]SEC62369.1 Nucleotide-binding universal stress protein, UspA family [Amycolatopsis tolypomycina]
MTATATRPVFVGVDASAASLDAVRWAAKEARRRETTLQLLHACIFEEASSRAGNSELLLEHAHRSLRRAAEIAGEEAPGVRVETSVRLGLAVDLLLAESGGAALVVLGSHGLGGLRGALIGSVALRVAAGASCPVVVVPTHRPHRTGPIVVGVDPSDSSEHALRFALEEAAAARAPVHVVHAWHDGLLVPEAVLADIGVAEQRELEAHLASWARKYPALDITARAVRDRIASRALLDAAPDARLIVVGTRGRGPVAGGLLGSTGNALLTHAACPVAVVRPSDREP